MKTKLQKYVVLEIKIHLRKQHLKWKNLTIKTLNA